MSISTKPSNGLDIDEVTKARVLLEALPYIQRFKGSIFVVKYGGKFMDDPDLSLRTRVITDIVLLAAVGIQVVVVHGGGRAISRAMEEAGIEATFVNGLRVTGKETIELVEKILNQVINRYICQLIKDNGGKSMSLPGNTVFQCVKRQETDSGGQPVDLGFVGEVTSVHTELVECALAGGYTPVLSSVALDDKGNPHNTNADSAASHLASALGARRLVYLCDVPGLLRDRNDENSIISTLRIGEVEELKRSGVISEGMLPKVESAASAIHKGVRRVHFVEGGMQHGLLLEIFTDKGIGTEIVQD